MAEFAETPGEYIAAQKRKHPSQPITLEMVEQALAGQIGDGMDASAVLEEVSNSDYVQRLLKIIWARLPENVRAFIDSGDIAVGELDEPTFDARSIPLARGHAIIIHRGTHQFVYRIARILSTRFVPDGADDPALTFEDTARLLAEAFWWYVESGRAFGPEYPVTIEQRHIASRLTLEAMAFVLCHEIGHAVADREAPLGHKEEIEASPHLDEHGADVLGAAWALGLPSRNEPQEPMEMAMRYAGIEFVLQVWAMLEQLGCDFADTHPAARDRLALIRQTLRERCDGRTFEALTAMARGTEGLFQRIAELLEDPSEHQSFFEAQAAAVVAELNTLLDRCATIPVPDYFTFFAEAGAVFGRGYPEHLLERIATAAGEFLSDAETDEPWSTERVLRFHKFKLLFAYVSQHLNEPARSIFGAALGLRN
jgi:hypothetical protein